MRMNSDIQFEQRPGTVSGTTRRHTMTADRHALLLEAIRAALASNNGRGDAYDCIKAIMNNCEFLLQSTSQAERDLLDIAYPLITARQQWASAITLARPLRVCDAPRHGV